MVALWRSPLLPKRSVRGFPPRFTLESEVPLAAAAAAMLPMPGTAVTSSGCSLQHKQGFAISGLMLMSRACPRQQAGAVAQDACRQLGSAQQLQLHS